MSRENHSEGRVPSTAEKLLEGAYKLKTSADNVEYYRAFAPIYDEQFAAAMEYSYPSVVARQLLNHFRGDSGPLLDVGCGTGLVATKLVGIKNIDGVDLSSEMLEVAKQKSLYRTLYCQDLNLGIGKLPVDYAGVVSAGTFTHGHLGPDVVDWLLDVGRRDCVYCLGVNAGHYKARGFESTFERLLNAGAIRNFCTSTHFMFGSEGGQHAQDEALVIVFYKC